jgi:hypothetical protein
MDEHVRNVTQEERERLRRRQHRDVIRCIFRLCRLMSLDGLFKLADYAVFICEGGS